MTKLVTKPEIRRAVLFELSILQRSPSQQSFLHLENIPLEAFMRLHAVKRMTLLLRMTIMIMIMINYVDNILVT